MWYVNAVALGEVDGQPVVVAGSSDKTVRLWDPRTCRPRREPLTGHTGSVIAVALGELDGQPVVASGSNDQTVRLWDLRTGQPRGKPLTGHTGSVSAVALVHVDGQPVLVSASRDETVRLWDLRTHTLSRTIPLASSLSDLAIVNDSEVAVGGSRGLILLDFSATREV
jgi:WD40 repeat protein